MAKEFKTYFKSDIPQKEKRTKSQMWNDMKARSFKKSIEKNKPLLDADNLFYTEIWKERLKKCEKCGTDLGSTWENWNFHHILLKSKRPDLRYDKENILLCCLQCHSQFHT